MNFEAETIDDLMNDILKVLVNRPFDIVPTKGATSEIFGAILQLNNPRARLSRTETRGKTFSALGEFLWYMAKNNKLEYIRYYINRYKNCSDDGETIYGGYGPRLFNMRGKYNQVTSIIKLLKDKPNTRQAVIQLFDVEDLQTKHKDIPCTCTLQFILRDGKLNMLTSMRSNDAYLGLPHDIFCFTMLQEIIARIIGAELGIYKHVVGSLHLYEVNKRESEQYLSEGSQSTKHPMPDMPKGKPLVSIGKIIQFEKRLRQNPESLVEELNLDTYWLDLVYLLKIHALLKNKKYDLIETEKKKITNNVYIPFVQKKIDDLKIKFEKKE
jgi:thymidylate synthase